MIYLVVSAVLAGSLLTMLGYHVWLKKFYLRDEKEAVEQHYVAAARYRAQHENLNREALKTYQASVQHMADARDFREAARCFMQEANKLMLTIKAHQ